jgi:nucleotide-binding universal stress UspA family protein
MQRIVVGVDESTGSRIALHWAVCEAALRDAVVDAVHVWTNPLTYVAGYAPVVTDVAEVEAAAKEVLDRAVAGERADVPINPFLAEGTPSRVLLEVARGADLLVVGSRGRGAFAGSLLGSVSQHCTRHAPCPVVVVPS